MSFAQIKKRKQSSSLIIVGIIFFSFYALAGGEKINNLSEKDKTYLKSIRFEIGSQNILNQYLKKNYPKEQNDPFMVSMLCQKSKAGRKLDCKALSFEMLSTQKKK